MKKVIILSGVLFALLRLDYSPSLEFDSRQAAGMIEFMEYDEFGTAMYRVYEKDSVYEYLYYGEVMEWIESGSVEYNDFLIQ